MKRLKLWERKAARRGKIREKARRAVPSEEDRAALLSLTDTQPLPKLRIGAQSQTAGSVEPPPPRRAIRSLESTELSMESVEGNAGYDPYNNFGQAAAGRPRARRSGSRH